MKLTFFLLLFILSLSEKTFSQTEWEWKNPVPAGTRISSICFTNTTNAIAAGQNGSLIRSTDGGTTWKVAQQLTLKEINCLTFGNEDFGVAAGKECIYTTTDAGKTWKDTYPSPDFPNDGPYSCIDVQLTKKNNGWITASGKFLRTTDMGQSWKKITVNSEGILTSHNFLNDTLGFCTNSIGGVFRSTNSGILWTKIASTGLYWTKRIRFFTPLVGWMAGSRLYSNEGFIAKTTDGGITWIFQDSTGTGFNDLEVIDSLRVVAAGNKGWIKYTTDGGTTWLNSFTNNLDDNTDITKNGDTLWIVGGSDYYPIITKSAVNELYKPWTVLKNYFSLSNFNVINFENDSTGWLAGESGSLYKTTNGGNEWKPVPLFSVNFLSACSPASKTLFLGGDNGELVSTSDGGSNWKVSSFGQYKKILQIQFPTRSNGWFALMPDVAAGGLLYSTKNGGSDWEKVLDSASSPLRASKVQFIDSLNGWFCEPPPITAADIHYPQMIGRFFRTTDGGSHWHQSNTSGIIKTFFFTSANHGWAIYHSITDFINPIPMFTVNDTLYETSDGGKYWKPYSVVPFLHDAVELLFLSGRESWMRTPSAVYRSVDSGRTFSQQILFSRYYEPYLSRLYFQNSGSGWLVGNYGTLLHYSNRVTIVRNGISRAIPSSVHLFQNYPNPFNPTTTIEFDIPYDAHSSLTIYNAVGQQVDELFNNFKKEGKYNILWNAGHLPSGIYFYRLQCGNRSLSKKLVLIK
jgi:photosystem II stability/assembly factor-like uncharacterized protein